MVREAFSSLEVAGIIEKGNGRSPKVGELNSSFLAHLMVHAVSTKQISVKQVLELRCSIEALATELAARRRTRSDILRLWSTVEGMRRAVGKPAAFIQCDLDFHDVINQASVNPLIEVFCEAIRESMQESHEAIAKAIERGEAKLARVLMKKHFEEALTAMDSGTRRIASRRYKNGAGLGS
jgi:GntR family transcriptional repressor for pyruvate dehydrogenase complex